REIGLMIPLVVMMLIMGIFPKPFISRIEPTVKEIISKTEYKNEYSNKAATSSLISPPKN
ncbi:MAG: hypothetical protein ACRENO_02940, partial [Thermodesulfobacteriota bacterium]